MEQLAPANVKLVNTVEISGEDCFWIQSNPSLRQVTSEFAIKSSDLDGEDTNSVRVAEALGWILSPS